MSLSFEKVVVKKNQENALKRRQAEEETREHRAHKFYCFFISLKILSRARIPSPFHLLAHWLVMCIKFPHIANTASFFSAPEVSS